MHRNLNHAPYLVILHKEFIHFLKIDFTKHLPKVQRPLQASVSSPIKKDIMGSSQGGIM